MSSIAILLLLSGAVTTSCKSKKKMAEEKARQEAQALNNERNNLLGQLDALMDSPVRNEKDLFARMDQLAVIKQTISSGALADDETLNSRIIEVEDFLASEQGRLEQIAAEEAVKVEEVRNDNLKDELNSVLYDVASASNYEQANNGIKRAMGYFSSESTPVLIVIHEKNGMKDYDRPTTIGKYLDYLKDQQKLDEHVMNFKLDEAGKVEELELMKN